MNEQELGTYLRESTKTPVRLRINNNTHYLVTSRNGERGEIVASVHWIFLDAPPLVLRALAQFLRRPTPASRRVVREYIAANGSRLAQPARPHTEAIVEPAGRYYDLDPIAERLNREHFEQRLEFRITWGRRRRGTRGQSQITLGTCDARRKLIRIHPALDSPKVPVYYVDFIVYHEMLHLALPSTMGEDGRMRHHPPEFKRLEKRYPLYREAMAWQEVHLDGLLTRWARPPRPSTEGPEQLSFL